MANCFEIIFPAEEGKELNINGIKYTHNAILKVLESHNCKYFLVKHPIDSESNFIHFHCGIHTTSDNTYETIGKWFGLPASSVNKVRRKFETTYALYLIHYNQGDKTRIDPKEVENNFDFDYTKLITRVKKNEENESALLKIASGEIREYEFDDKLTDEFRLKNANKIKTALEIAQKRRMKQIKGESIVKTIMWLYGPAGTGKTTYAKYQAEKKEMPYYMSDSGENPFDNYAGQPCIILDDVGADNMNGKVILKLFDPHNKCFTKARYYNRALDPELIIVTSSMSPESFWSAVRDEYNVNGSWEQLTRRLNGGVFKFFPENKKSVEVTMYDSDGKNPFSVYISIPDEVSKLTNTVSAEVRFNNLVSSLQLNVKTGDISGKIEPASQIQFNDLFADVPPVPDTDETADLPFSQAKTKKTGKSTTPKRKTAKKAK